MIPVKSRPLNPSRPGGQNKCGPVTQGVGSKTRLALGYYSHRPYRAAVCAGAWSMTPNPTREPTRRSATQDETPGPAYYHGAAFSSDFDIQI
jgi:hypothetical protein